MDWFQAFDFRRLTASRIQNWLTGLVIQNLGYKALSIVIALGVWGWVQGERVSEVGMKIRVNYASLPDELVFSQPPQTRLRLTISGASARLRRLSKRELSLVMNLSDAEPGVINLEFPLEEIQGIPDDVTILRLVPNSVQVEIERKVTRTLKLVAAQVGMPADGYRLARIELSPEAIQVRGPPSILNRITEITTDGIPVDGLKASVRVPVGIHFQQDTLQRVGDQQVIANVTIESLTELRKFEGIPVTVTQGWGTGVQAVDVTLEGPIAELKQIKTSDLTAIVRIPPDTPLREITVRHDPNAAARLDIDHPGGSEVVVQDIKPSKLIVTPQ